MDLPVLSKCGGCTACCTVIGVQELGKPYYHRCEHQCSNGCRIYGNHPTSCKGFQCLYLVGLGGGNVNYRPDKFGFLFALGTEEGEDAPCLHIYCTQPLSVIPLDSCRKAIYAVDAVKSLLKKQGVTIKWTKFSPYNNEIGTQFDLRDPYPTHTQRSGNQFLQDNLEPTFLIHLNPILKNDIGGQLRAANEVMLKLFGRPYIPKIGDSDGK